MRASQRHIGNRRSRRPSGFTLIEMTVVILIIAIVSAGVVPAWARYRSHVAFDQSVQQVVALLQWARETARAQGTDVDVRFDAQSETFTASVTTDMSSASVNGTDASTDLPVAMQDQVEAAAPPDSQSVQLSQDVAITDFATDAAQEASGPGSQQAARDFAFHEDGSADSVHFIIRGVDGYAVGVAVYPATGQATVHDDVQ